jgi:hypothetical protein
VQDSVRKHAKKCKEFVFVYSYECWYNSHLMSQSQILMVSHGWSSIDDSAEQQRKANLGPIQTKGMSQWRQLTYCWKQHLHAYFMGNSIHWYYREQP